jgi:hypothetical protein
VSRDPLPQNNGLVAVHYASRDPLPQNNGLVAVHYASRDPLPQNNGLVALCYARLYMAHTFILQTCLDPTLHASSNMPPSKPNIYHVHVSLAPLCLSRVQIKKRQVIAAHTRAVYLPTILLMQSPCRYVESLHHACLTSSSCLRSSFLGSQKCAKPMWQFRYQTLQTTLHIGNVVKSHACSRSLLLAISTTLPALCWTCLKSFSATPVK